jgi:hypothetical protein
MRHVDCRANQASNTTIESAMSTEHHPAHSIVWLEHAQPAGRAVSDPWRRLAAALAL